MTRLMTHIVAGYPSLEESEKIAREMIEAGATHLEIQIPFSDPIADGPTIAQANQVALENGVSVDDCFSLLERLTSSTNIPILFMTYFNVVFKMGVDVFCERAKKAGAYGLIVPDIPIDEEPYENYLAACKNSGLHAIQVVSPLTVDERLSEIGEVASGFVYCVARKGITGSETTIDSALGDYLENVRSFIKLPLAVGFGISNSEQVKQVSNHADIAVVGSALIRAYEKAESNPVQSVGAFVAELVR